MSFQDQWANLPGRLTSSFSSNSKLRVTCTQIKSFQNVTKCHQLNLVSECSFDRTNHKNKYKATSMYIGKSMFTS